MEKANKLMNNKNKLLNTSKFEIIKYYIKKK